MGDAYKRSEINGNNPAPKRIKLINRSDTSVGINVIEIDGKSCNHEVAWPPGVEGSQLPPPPRPGPPAREYPFAIDPFQQTAISCLEAGHSVLVAAHTSAGKTVVAEYAIAMALRDNCRCIYTSPLKALSNQKMNQFSEEFGSQNVGLMTGDVTINPTAPCLILTTEVFRSMLYRGSEVVRETKLIVFDEVHWLRDAERGVVWEESMILSPKACRFAFLSATLPNASEFAAWIAKIHNSPCHTVYTEYRPTPLEHYIFPAGGEKPLLVIDEHGTFKESNFHRAVSAVQDNDKASNNSKKGKQDDKGGGSDIPKLVTCLLATNNDPMILFSFSKLACQQMLNELGDLDLNDSKEKKLVTAIFENAIDCLSEEDRKLPQVQDLLPNLKRGVASHHSGLLPIVKEVVEICFQEGLLKVLIATETFSTGLNMPARCCVFTSCRKFDSSSFRWLNSSEFIQMAGRAGRRGKDKKGVVVLMLNSKMEPVTARQMMQGSSEPLLSAFCLTFSMLLNIMRTEGAQPEELMRLSFRQFQTERTLPLLEQRATDLESQRDAIMIEGETQVEEYATLQQQSARLSGEIVEVVRSPNHAIPFLQPGRLIQVSVPTDDNSQDHSKAWVTVVNFQKASKRKETNSASDEDYTIDVLGNCTDGASLNRRTIPVSASVKGVPLVIPASLNEVTAFSSIRVYVPKDLRAPEQRALAVKALAEVERRFNSQIPLLDPVKDMKIEDERLKKLQHRRNSVVGLLEKHSLKDNATLYTRLQQYKEKVKLANDAKRVRKDIKAAQSLILQKDLKARRKVLKRLGYIDADEMVTTKGRVAAELSVGQELVLAEIIFDGRYNDLTPEQLCALSSCFVWREKYAGSKTPDDLQPSLGGLREAARRVGKVMADCGIATDVEEYVDTFCPDLMEVVIAWCRGAKFADISQSKGKDKKKGHLFEGSIVRALRRLEELLRQVEGALKTVGDNELAAKFEKGRELIKRDIVFAASLFL